MASAMSEKHEVLEIESDEADALLGSEGFPPENKGSAAADQLSAAAAATQTQKRKRRTRRIVYALIVLTLGSSVAIASYSASLNTDKISSLLSTASSALHGTLSSAGQTISPSDASNDWVGELLDQPVADSPAAEPSSEPELIITGPDAVEVKEDEDGDEEQEGQMEANTSTATSPVAPTAAPTVAAGSATSTLASGNEPPAVIYVDTQPPLPSPPVKDANARYLSYLPHSGFHNQRIEFQNGLLLAQLLNRTLLVPYVRAGKAQAWDVKSRLLSNLLRQRKSHLVDICRPHLDTLEAGKDWKSVSRLVPAACVLYTSFVGQSPLELSIMIVIDSFWASDRADLAATHRYGRLKTADQYS